MITAIYSSSRVGSGKGGKGTEGREHTLTAMITMLALLLREIESSVLVTPSGVSFHSC